MPRPGADRAAQADLLGSLEHRDQRRVRDPDRADQQDHLPRAAVRAFLKDLENALDAFVTAMERYVASGAQASRPHAELAVQHGIAVHRASLEWTRSALAALKPSPHDRVSLPLREGGNDTR